jgi:hypothetical protein
MGTSTERQQLLDMILEPDAAFSSPRSELAPLQLRAAQDLFALRRQQIPLLDRRARDAGIESIGTFDDLVPLLFSHTAYKSYPTALIEQQRWDRMLYWLNTLSVEDPTGVDVSGVRDVDEWIDRLWDAGHMVLATSGSSGKISFLDHTRGDRRMKTRHFRHAWGWPHVAPSRERAVFWLGPLKGPNSAIESGIINAENWGGPKGVFALTDEPLKIASVSRRASMRTRMAEGTATPAAIAEFEAEAAVAAAQGQEQMAKLADQILDLRDEPIMVSGLWAQYMYIVERGHERGIADGTFHPHTVINAGGGVKGVSLPPDYKEQVARFFGDVIRPSVYGMTEMASALPRCEANRYHAPPSLIMLMLDRHGERLLSPDEADADGLLVGRFAFLDLVYEGRWGGLISGDRVTVDVADRCPCGRAGPTLLDDISRFAQAGTDDHIGCAGTIDAYVRGVMAA